MAQEFPNEQYPNIRYFIGDVRDKKDYLGQWRVLILSFMPLL